MTLKEAMEGFIVSRQLMLLTEKTIEDYRYFISPFVLKIGGDMTTSAITLAMVQKYILSLTKKDISKTTFNTYLRHLKVFLRWGNEEMYWDIPVEKIKITKDETRHPKILNDEEIRHLFASIQAESQWIIDRDSAIVALMLDSGLRRIEVINLNWNEIYFADGTMRVHGKGRKERIVPLGKTSAYYLQRYKLGCPYEINGKAFLGRRGKPITIDTIRSMMQKLKRLSGLPVHAHMLRHNFATNFCIDQYEEGDRLDIKSLSAILGHEDVRTTERYTHIAESELAARHHHSHLDKVAVR